MGVTEEIFRLRAEVVNAAKIQDLNADLNKTHAQLSILKSDYDNHLITDAQYGDGVDKLSASFKKLNVDLKATEAAAKNLKNPFAAYQQNIQGLGYSLNDFFSVQGSLQQRLNAIANNMPMLLAGFGGWGLLLSGLLPIIGMLLPQIQNLWKAIAGGDEGGIASSLDALKARIKELEKIEIKPAVDMAELNAAKQRVDEITAALAAYQKLQRSTTGMEKESGQRVNEVLTESPGAADALKSSVTKELMQGHGGLADSRKKQAELAGKVKEAEAAKARDLFGDPFGDFQRKIDSAKQELADEQDVALKFILKITQGDGKNPAEADVKVGEMLKDATEGGGLKQATGQKQIAKHLRNAGMGNVAGEVEAFSPEAIREDADAEDALDTSIKNIKAAFSEKRAKTKDDAAKKKVRDKEDHDDALFIIRNMPGETFPDREDRRLRVDERKAEIEKQKAKDALDTEVKAKNRKDVEAELYAKKNLPGAVFKDNADRDRRIEEDKQRRAEDKIKDDATKLAQKARDEKNEAVGKQAEAQEQIKAKDDAALEKGLGDQFIGQAHMQRLGIEENQFLTPGQKDKARNQFQKQLRVAAKNKLQAGGVDPDEAERLSFKAGGFMGKDLDKQFNQADAQFDQFDGVEGQNDRHAVAQSVYAQIQQQLAAMRAKAAGQKPKQGGGLKSVGVGPAPAQQGGEDVAGTMNSVVQMGEGLARQANVNTQNLRAVQRRADQVARAMDQMFVDQTFLPVGP